MNDIDWSNLVAQADDGPRVDPAELKRRVDLVAVVESLGVTLEPQPDGKHKGLCPFHDDRTPSFDVYEMDDGSQRCGCFSCGFGPSNDVYDFLRKIRGYGFGEALREAQRFAAGTDVVRRSAAAPRPVRDLAAFVATAHRDALNDPSLIQTLLVDRGVRVPVEWLIREFELGVTPDGLGVVMPHRSREGDVVGAKVRRQTAGGQGWQDPIAIGGSQLRELYGVWRDARCAHVVLVEGESDTWTTAYLLRQASIDVLGLPSGAAARPRREWLDYLGDREVTTLFDADDAGRTALRNWAGGFGVLRVAQLDEGTDATSASPARVASALAHAKTLGMAATAGLVEAPYGGWVRADDQRQTMISDFTLSLVRTVEIDDGGHLFEVRLPVGATALLATTDLETDARFRHWANRYGLVFAGTTRDAQEVLRLLLLDSVYHPLVRGTRTAGWVGSGFVFPAPHGAIGTKSWAYVPPVADIELHKLVHLQPGRWDTHLVHTLATLHEPYVVTPILGWVAAAPLRAMMKAFPVLAVVGTAGAGKSTLVREVLRTFGYEVNTTLTSTTPHAVSSFAAATNAAPVWFDEYRRGAREDARLTFEQVIRDAWESSASWKGGLGDQRQALTRLPAAAPIVVTGEDAFSETSHLERMVMINLPRDGRSRSALETLYASHRDGFGRAYLEWLCELVENDTLPSPPAVPDRPAHARAVARWGYGLLEAFARSVCGVELPAYDGTLVDRAHGEETPVIDEALRVCDGRFGRSGPIVWREDNDYCVRVHDLVRECRDLAIQLPGGARAVRNELADRYDVTEERNSWGTFLRLRVRG